MKLGNTMLIHNKDDIEFVTEFPCFLGHPVVKRIIRRKNDEQILPSHSLISYFLQITLKRSTYKRLIIKLKALFNQNLSGGPMYPRLPLMSLYPVSCWQKILGRRHYPTACTTKFEARLYNKVGYSLCALMYGKCRLLR